MNISMRTQLAACIAATLAFSALPARAQDPSMPGMVMPAKKKTAAPKKTIAAPAKPASAAKPAPSTTRAKPAADPRASMSGMDMSNMSGMAGMAGMSHGTVAKPKPASAPRTARKSTPAPAKRAIDPMPGMDMSGDASKRGMGSHTKPAKSMQGMDPSMPGMDHSTMPGMDHSMPGMAGMPGADKKADGQAQEMDPSMPGMDHSTMPGMDHSAMPGMSDMQGMQMGATDLPPDAPPLTPVPALTDADRTAAFPKGLSGHAVHDSSTQSFWLADRLEIADGRGNGAWEGMAWIGGDINRVWLRSEGNVADRRVEDGRVEVLYGHSISPWWDVVTGVREDFGVGPSRTSAAIGVQGLAPYKFEAAATAYVGSGGRVSAILEGDYDTLFTNRLIMQWRSEARLSSRSDPLRGTGAGLSTVEVGARLRYEITRQFAPYVGVEVEHAFGGTAGLRRAEGRDTTDTRIVAGIRFWF